MPGSGSIPPPKRPPGRKRCRGSKWLVVEASQPLGDGPSGDELPRHRTEAIDRRNPVPQKEGGAIVPATAGTMKGLAVDLDG